LAQVVWSAAAVTDLAAIRAYIAQFNPVAAAALAAALVESADSLASFPYRGRPRGRNRRELLAIWPYVVGYRIVDDRVIILRVRHGHRRD
jgi:plasmid stabilization system protein ParE